jgi:hypothetical protein
MGSNPIIGTLENAILREKIAQIRNLIGCEWSRIETHEITVYSSTIRQVTEPCLAFFAEISRR